MSEQIFFHVDLDAFFASVEILDNPSLKGKPVVIGHRSSRSVVATCNYEARKYGIHSAMPMVHALKL
jgi:DNA polymerase-4